MTKTPKDKWFNQQGLKALNNSFFSRFLNKARVYFEKAIKEAEKEKKPSGLYWSNLSIVYGRLKMWDKAISTVEKAIKLLKKEEAQGIKHHNQIKILELEKKLYSEYKKRKK